jgi:FkbM family methyltransferase
VFNRLYNSLAQSLLIGLYRAIAARVDLSSGALGWLYASAYFAYKRFQDRNIVRVTRKLIQPGTLVIDVGANIGFFSIAMQQLADVTVLAFEPAPDNFRQLTEVLTTRGNAGRIYPFQLALSDRTGKALLHLSDFAPTDHKLIDSRSSTTVEIATTTLDDFLGLHPEFAGFPVSLIKIDVQGAELLVLHGMVRTLEINHRPPILVEYAPGDLALAGISPQEFFAAFEKLGYRPHSIPQLSPCSPESLIENTRAAYTDLVMLYSSS